MWVAFLCFIAPQARGQSLTPTVPPARALGPSPTFPAGLRAGDAVAIVAPAGPLERGRIELAARRLADMGLRVRVPDDLYRQRGYLAGEDEVRAAELMAAFRDPDIKAIFPGSGGYGSMRILDRVEYDVIARNPKILHGFSDITALHLAIQKKTGLVTFHGPVIAYGLGSRDNLTDFSARYFRRALWLAPSAEWIAGELPGGFLYEVPAQAGGVRMIAPGRARGRLTGGNLSLVCALMGTPYEIETDGRILFLEDVNEEPYRIDRMLAQLRLGGKLERLAGVVVGKFTGCESVRAVSLSVEQVFTDYFAGLPVPVLADFPAGHFTYHATLPMNALYEIDADAGSVRLLEEPVRPTATTPAAD
ncbi:MAG: muramoyltetrapeptide carboxypeptidase [Phycisphaerae bacterium]